MSAALKAPARTATTDRDRLAEAIAENEARMFRTQAIEKALEKLRAQRNAMNGAVAKARDALEEAKTATAKQLVDRALGLEVEHSISPKEAQDALTEAENRAAELETAHAALKQEHVEACGGVGYNTFKLRKALSDVLAASPEVKALLNRFEAVRAESVALHLALLIVLGRSTLPAGWDNAREYSDNDIAKKWQDAIERLEKDANAPLPK